MIHKEIDEKQAAEDTEVVKEKNDPKRNYIFQNNKITRTGFFIIIGFLILIILGIVLSGTFFGSEVKNP